MDPEGHPIPQDITGFQFRLIGDMTVKQFAYLAGGAIAAWLVFSTPLPVIIKLPFAAGCGLLGVMLAFMPIHGRPADVMLMLFFKALFKPNQFTYKKTDGTQLGLSSSAPIETGSENQKISTPENQTTPQTNSPAPNQNSDVPSVVPTNTGISDIPAKRVLSDSNPKVTTNIPTNPAQQPAPVPTPTSTTQLPTTPNPTPIPPQPNPVNQIPTPPPPPVTLNKIPVIPLDAINLVAGVVEDPRGNVLQNILVEVTDTAGSPVRAFKTNQMGQFIAATPLENGTYTITLEDPDKRHQFPTLSITATGEPLQPLEIKSMDQREQLRQSLFTPTAIPPVQQTN